MNRLRQILVDYLDVRRALGYKLERFKLLDQYLGYVESRHEERLRLETMLAWAMLPPERDSGTGGVPPLDCAPLRRPCTGDRSDCGGAIRRRLAVAPLSGDSLPLQRPRAERAHRRGGDVAHAPSHRHAYRTLLGLLVVTGMRVGEALALDRGDIDAIDHVLTIRLTKFGKSREVPVYSRDGRRAPGLRGTP